MLRKILLTLLITLLAFLALVFFQSVDPVQQERVEVPVNFPLDVSAKDWNIDSLKEVVGPEKGLPEGFELAGLLAYAAYPELKGLRIDMELTESGAPMESNFDFSTLFGSRDSRVYKVWLNDAAETEYDEILLRSLPLDAQVGILAHELGHVAYYHQHSTLELIKFGIFYFLDSDFRAKHERSTDLMPVYHGLGSQIYQYAYYVRHDPSCVDLYEEFGKEFVDKYYMTDVELKRAWEEQE